MLTAAVRKALGFAAAAEVDVAADAVTEVVEGEGVDEAVATGLVE